MDTQKIDWTQPVETTDGMLMTYFPDRNTSQPGYSHWVEGPEDTCISSFYSDSGKPWSSYKPDLRNVAPKEVEWGPEIKVEGKRPEWLIQDGKLWKRSFDGYEQKDLDVVSVHWPNTDWIRLPANHPHYTTPTRTALEQRMHSLIKHAAVNASGYTQEEARAILAELEPVDPDVIEADAIMTTIGFRNVDPCSDIRKVALAALRRGRALERGE